MAGLVVALAGLVVALAFAVLLMVVVWLPFNVVVRPFDQAPPPGVAERCHFVDYDPTGDGNDRLYRLDRAPVVEDGWVVVEDGWYSYRDRDSMLKPYYRRWAYEPHVRLRSDADVRIYNRCGQP